MFRLINEVKVPALRSCIASAIADAGGKGATFQGDRRVKIASNGGFFRDAESALYNPIYLYIYIYRESQIAR
jgi:hypothetical protein